MYIHAPGGAALCRQVELAAEHCMQTDLFLAMNTGWDPQLHSDDHSMISQNRRCQADIGPGYLA